MSTMVLPAQPTASSPVRTEFPRVPSRTPHPHGVPPKPHASTTGAQADSVKAITTGLLAGRIGGRPVSFLLAPYSSGLSEVASKLANEGGALLVAAVSA